MKIASFYAEMDLRVARVLLVVREKCKGDERTDLCKSKISRRTLREKKMDKTDNNGNENSLLRKVKKYFF